MQYYFPHTGILKITGESLNIRRRIYMFSFEIIRRTLNIRGGNKGRAPLSSRVSLRLLFIILIWFRSGQEVSLPQTPRSSKQMVFHSDLSPAPLLPSLPSLYPHSLSTHTHTTIPDSTHDQLEPSFFLTWTLSPSQGGRLCVCIFDVASIGAAVDLKGWLQGIA